MSDMMRAALEKIAAHDCDGDARGYNCRDCRTCIAVSALNELEAQAEQRGEMEWEMRIAGPDDVLVFSDELEALQRANEVNKQYLADRLKHPDNEVLCVATVHCVDAQRAQL